MQSDVIFGFIAAAFIFYITAKGELGTYIDILRGGGQQAGNANSSGGSSLAQTVNSVSSDLSSADSSLNAAENAVIGNAANQTGNSNDAGIAALIASQGGN